MAYTLPSTFLPSTMRAAARRSPMRELVHDPMKTRSNLMSSIGVPASNPMYCSARSSPSLPGVGIDAVTGATCAGLVPQLTIGLIAEASTTTSWSKCAPSSV